MDDAQVDYVCLVANLGAEKFACRRTRTSEEKICARESDWIEFGLVLILVLVANTK